MMDLNFIIQNSFDIFNKLSRYREAFCFVLLTKTHDARIYAANDFVYIVTLAKFFKIHLHHLLLVLPLLGENLRH